MKTPDKPFIVDLTDGRELPVNMVMLTNYIGSQHVICLGLARDGVGADGLLRQEAAIIARLRFDQDMAIRLRDGLNRMIAALETPPKETAN